MVINKGVEIPQIPIFIFMFRPFILAAALLLSLQLKAQMMPFKNYGIKDGLSDNNVQAVIRDDRGLLWVGTDFGIYWFDGARFYRPQIKANVGQLYVTGFYKDFNGTVWILTFFNGIFKFENGRFTNYLVDPALKDATTNSIAGMTQLSAGRYLILTQNRPYIFDGAKFFPLESENIFVKGNVNGVTQMPDKTTMLGTDDGIFMLRYNKNKLVMSKHFLPGALIERVAAANNLLWAISDKGAFSFSYQPDTPFLAKRSVYLPGKNLTEIAAGNNGEVWAIGSNGSFWDVADTVYKIKNGKVTSYNKSNGLPENVQQIYSDDEGVVWFANRKGLSALADEYYTFTRLASGGHNDPVTSLIVDNENRLWAGSINGLAQLKDSRYTLHPDVGSTEINYVSWLSKPANGACLAGTVAGVLKIGHNKIEKFLTIHSTAFCESSDSSMWFGGITGEIWTSRRGKLKQLKLSGNTHEMVTALYTNLDQVWVGFRDKGIIRYRVRGDSLVATGEFTAATGYPDMRVRCCAADNRGNIFFGTRTSGMYVFNPHSKGPVAHISTQNGLNANWIKDIVFDQSNTLYLATNNGINIVTGNYSKPRVSHIKIDDDNINRETNCLVKAGNLFYIGTNEGILKWMPASLHKDTVPPPVYLTKIDIQGRKNFAIRPYTMDAGEIELPYDQHFISFEFAGISLKNPEKLSYHYMLTGQDNGWSPLIGHNDVAFDLKPGYYTFKVAAMNEDGVWSRRPAVFHFIIKPPFWLSWWFILMMVALTVFVAYSAYRYKLSKALALELLRNKISTDLHDDIGSTLSSISILSEVAAREKEQKSKRILGEINERSYLLMEKMDDIVWSISTQNDTVGNLFSRVQQFASTILEARDIEYEFRVPDKLKELKLDMQRRQHIYLVLKEAINNLIKYSGCTSVCILAEYSAGLLKIEVADDGKGFDTNQLSSGNGLLNMQKRTEAMRGKLCIASSPGKGTRVSLAVQIE
jgi:ligand-binding sensor domain-containing protein/two-component sensor histidine kinase